MNTTDKPAWPHNLQEPTFDTIVEYAPGVYIDITGIEDHNRYADGTIDVEAAAQRLRDIASAASGRSVLVALTPADANLMKRGNGFIDVTNFFADDIEAIVEGDEFWINQGDRA